MMGMMMRGFYIAGERNKAVCLCGVCVCARKSRDVLGNPQRRFAGTDECEQSVSAGSLVMAPCGAACTDLPYLEAVYGTEAVCAWDKRETGARCVGLGVRVVLRANPNSLLLGVRYQCLCVCTPRALAKSNRVGFARSQASV